MSFSIKVLLIDVLLVAYSGIIRYTIPSLSSCGNRPNPMANPTRAPPTISSNPKSGIARHSTHPKKHPAS
uniref:Putative secreted protein n=1 Tax=Anopheles triannulatus TaxID=58253 RepID=A0A2M4B7U9_9DIPT